MDHDHAELIRDLFHTFYPQMLIFAQSSLHNQHLAEEAVQEAFHIACKKSHALGSSKNPKGWMLNTLRLVIYEMRRKTAKELLLCESYDPALHDPSVDQDVLQSLDILYADYYDTKAFQLVKGIAVDGVSISDMAQNLRISEKACRKRLERAKKYLRLVL